MRKHPILISIIIPTLNEEKNLENLLKQLNELKTERTEIIVSDGGSTDETRSVAERFADTLVISQKGRALQMNAAANYASGEILWFLHSDSKLYFDYETEISSQLTTRSWGWCTAKLDSTKGIFRVIESLMNIRSKLTHIATGDQGFFVRKASFIQVNKFPEIPLMEDIVMSCNLKRIGKPYVSKNKIHTSCRKWEREGPIRTIFRMWMLRARFFLGAPPEKLEKVYYRA